MKRELYKLLSGIDDMKKLCHFKILIENIYSCIQFGKRIEKVYGKRPIAFRSGDEYLTREDITKTIFEDEELKNISEVIFESDDKETYITGLMSRTEGDLVF